MTGHQNVVNDVKYSPDVKYVTLSHGAMHENNFKLENLFLIFRLIASASFDKSVRLWRAHDGAFICTFRGHVQAVYTIAWSVDSRLLCSGSKDSTLKGKNMNPFDLFQDKIDLFHHIVDSSVEYKR